MQDKCSWYQSDDEMVMFAGGHTKRTSLTVSAPFGGAMMGPG